MSFQNEFMRCIWIYHHKVLIACVGSVQSAEAVLRLMNYDPATQLHDYYLRFI